MERKMNKQGRGNLGLCIFGVCVIGGLVALAQVLGHNGLIFGAGASAIVGIIGYRFGLVRGLRK